jgi:hypothetical protein
MTAGLDKRMAKQTKLTLDERIAAALSADAPASADLEQLFDEIEAALPSAEDQATAAHERALDPRVLDAAGARNTAQDLAFRVRRLKAALPPLGRALAAARQQEEQAAWVPRYEAVAAEVATAAAEFAQSYRDCVSRLIDLFQGAAAVDQKVQQVNSSAPRGEHRRLLGVELTARGLKNFSMSNPSLAKTVQLPEFADAGRMAWPPFVVPDSVLIAESVARSVARMPSPVHDLAGYHAAQDAGRRADAEHTAAHYRRLNADRAEQERTARIARATEQEAM